MTRLFKPAVWLMNRLSYPNKFLIVIAFFAVPLAITSIQNILSMLDTLKEDNKRLSGLELLLEVEDLLPEAALTRDLRILRRSGDNPKSEELYQIAWQASVDQISRILAQPDLIDNSHFRLSLHGVRASFKKMNTVGGSEGDLPDNIFDDAHSVVEDIYEFNQSVANATGISSDTDFFVDQLLRIAFEDLPKAIKEMGRSRALGAYYLHAQFLSSNDIELIEENYIALGRFDKKIRERLSFLTSNYPAIVQQTQLNPDYLNGILDIQLMVDEALLLDSDLTTSWEVFLSQAGEKLHLLTTLKRSLMGLIQDHYADRIESSSTRLLIYTIGVGFLILLSVYFFVGFYLSMRNSVGELVNVANRISDGNLQEEVQVDTQDEMQELAQMMDDMRCQLLEREAQLLALTLKDALTDVGNRKFFNEELARTMLEASTTDKPLCLLLVDIDHFKKLNDSYGHQAGDFCLQVVAQILKNELIRSSDTVSRYGGEEFAILLPGTDIDGGLKATERIMDAIRDIEVNADHGEIIRMTVSIGIAESSMPGCTDESGLILSADKALYAAKESGRNCCVSANEL